MMRLSRPSPMRRSESTITLINVVFLMLIFFLIAGTLAPPLNRDIDLISTATAEHAAPPDALFVTREGALLARGRATDPESYVAMLEAGGAPENALEIKLAADRELPATRLIEIVAALRQAGADKVSIITERSTE